MRSLFFGLWCILFLPTLVDAAGPPYNSGATNTNVNITSSSAGTQVVSAMRYGCTVNIASDEVGAIFLVRTEGTAASVVTADGGIRLSRAADKDPAQYEFKQTDGWRGQIVGILESGSTAITVHVNCW